MDEIISINILIIFESPLHSRILLTSKNTEINVNQTSLYKLNLKMFGAWACNYNRVSQIASKKMLSETVWAYSFHSSFSVPEACNGLPFKVYICFMIILSLFFKKRSQKGLNRNKSWIFLHSPSKELHSWKLGKPWSVHSNNYNVILSPTLDALKLNFQILFA